MPNRQLSAAELETLARPLLAHVRERLNVLADGNAELLWRADWFPNHNLLGYLSEVDTHLALNCLDRGEV
jgi:hypothetical protein